MPAFTPAVTGPPAAAAPPTPAAVACPRPIRRQFPARIGSNRKHSPVPGPSASGSLKRSHARKADRTLAWMRHGDPSLPGSLAVVASIARRPLLPRLLAPPLPEYLQHSARNHSSDFRSQLL